MKRKIILFSLILQVLIIALNTAQSQERNLVIKFKDGNVSTLTISNVKKIAFVSSMMNINVFDGTNAVYANSDIQKMYFENTTEVPSINDNRNVFVYPNPTKGLIYFKGLPEETVAVRMFNVNGVQVFSGRVNASVQSLDISFLPRGIYIINLNNQIAKLIKL